MKKDRPDYGSKIQANYINDKAREYTLLGHEIETDVVYCYMEITKVKKLKSIEIVNSILTNVYDDQTNLVHIEVDDKIRSMRMVRSETTDKIVY
ncbi:MAG: DUF6702 family protein [Bacteroidota bacterium]